VRSLLSLSIFFSSLALIGCGGSDSSSSSLIEIDFSTSLKGIENEPELAKGTLSEGDAVSINTELTGNLSEGDVISFSFSPTDDGYAALVLSSSAEDFDFDITSTGLSINGDGLTSDEMAVFYALKGEVYLINVIAAYGNGDFLIKLVEANRETLALSKDEYFVVADVVTDEACYNEFFDFSASGSYEEQDQFILNGIDGYVRYGNDLLQFESSTASSFIIKTTYAHLYDFFSDDEEYTWNINVSTENGEIKGVKEGSVSNFFAADSGSCQINAEYDGNVIL
jgi:hypothetical protein